MESDKASPVPPAEGGRRACDMVRTTDGQEVHSCKRYFEESPIGAIAVTVSVRVTELAIDVDHYDMPAEFQVRLMVERENDDAPDKPDIWSVMYVRCIFEP